jgi:hypothetical protein
MVTELYKSLVRSRLELGMCVAMLTVIKIDQTILKSVQIWMTKCINELKNNEYVC